MRNPTFKWGKWSVRDKKNYITKPYHLCWPPPPPQCCTVQPPFAKIMCVSYRLENTEEDFTPQYRTSRDPGGLAPPQLTSQVLSVVKVRALGRPCQKLVSVVTEPFFVLNHCTAGSFNPIWFSIWTEADFYSLVYAMPCIIAMFTKS